MATPTIWTTSVFRGKATVLQLRRAVRDLRDGNRRFARADAPELATLLAESVTELWTAGRDAHNVEQSLTAGKIQNLRVAARRLDGIVIPANRIFSFWRQVGRATHRGGYVMGRELREGCIVPAVGGGLCQLSNALYDAALRAGLEIVERHAHSVVVRGSLAEINRDATIFWNYVDLRFRSDRAVRLEVRLTETDLIVRYWGSGSTAAPRHPEGGADSVDAGAPGECASCGEHHCFRKNDVLASRSGRFGRTAYLVDEFWPEFDTYMAGSADPEDLLFVPFRGRLGRGSYSWNVAPFSEVRESRVVTVLRALRSRRAAAQGPVRQRVLLDGAARLAQSFGVHLPHDVTHVVVMQHLLPALWSGGHLGGRTFDVLMTGLPLDRLQRTLDDAYLLHPASPTLHDYRVDPQLIATEAEALVAARSCISPHAYVRAAIGSQAVAIPWDIPVAERRWASPRGEGRRAIVFPAPTLARRGAFEVRAVARALDLRVIGPGIEFEGDDFWEGVAYERWTSATDAFEFATAVVLPAFVEHRPRLLLAAAASGVPVIATENCGLRGISGVVETRAGEDRALTDAVAHAIG